MLKRLVPRTVKSTVKNVKSTVKKWLLFGHLAPLVPPEELMHEGPGSYEVFKQNSEEFFRYYVDLCGLKPDERILDVGCGIGRKTIRLTQYLGDGGSYEGIDIVESGIDWCSEHISRRYPRFRFQQIDVYNGYYNPGGRHKAAEYRFPYPDGSFDFVVLGSVFTHMLTDDTEHYLSEVARVLRPKGRTLISWFLLNQESRDLCALRQGHTKLHARDRRCLLVEKPAALGRNDCLRRALRRGFIRTVRTGDQAPYPLRIMVWAGRVSELSGPDHRCEAVEATTSRLINRCAHLDEPRPFTIGRA